MQKTSEIPQFEFDKNLFDDDFEFPETSFPLGITTFKPVKYCRCSFSSNDKSSATSKAKSTVYKITNDGRTLRNFFRRYGGDRDLHCIPLEHSINFSLNFSCQERRDLGSRKNQLNPHLIMIPYSLEPRLMAVLLSLVANQHPRAEFALPCSQKVSCL